MGKNIFDDLPLTLSRQEPRPAKREPRPEPAEPQLFPGIQRSADRSAGRRCAGGLAGRDRRACSGLVADAFRARSPRHRQAQAAGKHAGVSRPCRPRRHRRHRRLLRHRIFTAFGASEADRRRFRAQISAPSGADIARRRHNARHRGSRRYPQSASRAAASDGRRNRSATDQSRPDCPAGDPEQRIAAASCPGAKACADPRGLPRRRA